MTEKKSKTRPRTKIFFDTEFTGLRQDTTLISIGLISECGKTFYAELTDYDKTQVDTWIKDNVISNLYLPTPINESSTTISTAICYTMKGTHRFLAPALEQWLEQFDKVEMWSDCLAYDWVLFHTIFGGAFKIPKNVYYIPFDLCTLFEIQGVDPDVSREEYAELTNSKGKHNALWDAKVIKSCYEKAIKTFTHIG